MPGKISDTRLYEKLIGVFKKNKTGITLADVSAGTGIPLEQVKTLVAVAADEYSARLEVTESGEILYSFPRGFVSRYRGPGPVIKRFFSAFVRFSSAALRFLFKIWIMVMLIGYFLLFVAIALASVILSVSASSGSRRRGHGGGTISLGLPNMIMRLWLYSELFGSSKRYTVTSAGRGRPLHRAIFSFVFGDDDPNRDRESLEKKAFISYLRRRKGVASVTELMILSGKPPDKAEEFIGRLCAEFGGRAEVTDEGVIVYRFDDILMTGEKEAGGLISDTSSIPMTLYKKLKVFSGNPGKMNFWFGLINGVNLFFGSYFLYSSYGAGSRPSRIYAMVHYALSGAGFKPLPFIPVTLGLIPLLFSLFFWLIPGIRSLLLRRENERIRLDNFRGLGYSRIWKNPEAFRPAELNPGDTACRPADLDAARDRVIHEMGSYAPPELSMDEKRNEIFSFPDLRREKDSLEKYRSLIDSGRSSPGATVFDSEVKFTTDPEAGTHE